MFMKWGLNSGRGIANAELYKGEHNSFCSTRRQRAEDPKYPQNFIARCQIIGAIPRPPRGLQDFQYSAFEKHLTTKLFWHCSQHVKTRDLRHLVTPQV
jgi:hypothetical protein